MCSSAVASIMLRVAVILYGTSSACVWIHSTSLHQQDRQERDEERWWSAWRESRNQAASRLQAAVRGQRLRQQIRREARALVVWEMQEVSALDFVERGNSEYGPDSSEGFSCLRNGSITRTLMNKKGYTAVYNHM